MTKTKSTKRALLLSALSLLMCVSMLIGSTFAWFTDSVTTAGNTIQSGTLKVDLVDANDKSMEGEVIEFVTADNRAQDTILWEPGCTYKTEPVYVVNNGNLALKYQIFISGIEGNATLLKAIDWTVTIGGVKKDLDTFEGTLIPGESVKSGAIVLSGHMKEEAGNEYQGLTVKGISIAVYATQLTHENDSEDNQYDADADYVASVGNADELAVALKAGGKIELLNDIAITEPIEVPEGVTATLDLNGKTISGDIAKADGPIVKNNGTLVINGGTISSTATNGGSAIVNYGTLTVNDTVLNGAPIQDGGWPSYGLNNYGMLTINGAEINTYHGGVATGADAVTVINDADIDVGQGTETNQTSWAIYAFENGEVTVNGGTFANTKNENGEVYGGGYICTSSTKPMTINGGTFDKTESDNNGTGLYYNNQNLVINGGTFDTNPTAYAKGLVVNNGNGTWTVKPFEVSTAADLADKLANGSPVILTSDVAFTSKLTITQDAYIDANGKTIKFTSGSSDRFIDVPMESLGADLTIKNAVIDIDGSYCQRGINYNTDGILTLDNVTLTGATKATYGINLPAASSNATVEMTNCDITAYIALNVWGENAVINVTDCNLSNYDENSTEGEDYSTVKLNNDGTYSAEGTIITITGGTITAKDETGADFVAISNGTATGAIVVSNTTVVDGLTVANVAVVRFTDGNGNFYGEFYDTDSLQGAVTLASNAANAEVFLLTDINVATLNVPANVIIHKNGHSLTIGATTGGGSLDIRD